MTVFLCSAIILGSYCNNLKMQCCVNAYRVFAVLEVAALCLLCALLVTGKAWEGTGGNVFYCIEYLICHHRPGDK